MSSQGDGALTGSCGRPSSTCRWCSTHTSNCTSRSGGPCAAHSRHQNSPPGSPWLARRGGSLPRHRRLGNLPTPCSSRVESSWPTNHTHTQSSGWCGLRRSAMCKCGCLRRRARDQQISDVDRRELEIPKKRREAPTCGPLAQGLHFPAQGTVIGPHE